jgi:DNA-binding response OmpR family regulator
MSNPGESRRDGSATRHVRFKSVLLVEEDETWALAVMDALSEGGYRVALAGSVDEALRALRHKSPDLLLVSALLGEAASETLLRELEALKLPPPVLLVGSRKGESRWRAWRSLAFVTAVEQPFELPDVREAAEALLGAPWEDLIEGAGPDAPPDSPA